MKFKIELQKLIYHASCEVLGKRKVCLGDVLLEHPGDLTNGDYSTNIALRLKKDQFTAPMDLANQIVTALRTAGLPSYLARIDIAQPGFINLWLSTDFFGKKIEEVLSEGDRFGSGTIGKGKTMVIDYSGPNIAKPFGIGHLRSTNIGQSIYNLYKFQGWKVIGDNHLGDWGTQFGKLIVAIKKWNGKGKLDIEKLEKLYVKFHAEAEKHPELEDEAREWFKKLEDNDLEARKIWQKCVDISMTEFNRVYELLGVKLDFAFGESFYQDKMQTIVENLKRKKLLKESQGALVVYLDEYNLPPAIVIKSNEGTTYLTRDLAAFEFRKNKWNPDLYVFEVGADQKLYFRQLFAVAEKLGYGKGEQFVHVAHGLIRFAEGKMSTRKGQTIHLEKVLEEAIAKAEKIIKRSGTGRDLGVRERNKIAQRVGIGAVKYSDLRQNPQTDIVFDWDRIFNLEGDSGPYLQYTYARCQSVLAKSGKRPYFAKASQGKKGVETGTFAPEELAIIRTIYKFPEVVENAASGFAPNLICGYLFDLAQKYNLLYNTLPILQPQKTLKNLGEAQMVREMRLALTSATAQVIKNGLGLLGIEVLERM